QTPEGSARHDGDQERGEAELERFRKALEVNVAAGQRLLERVTEVRLEKAPDEREVLPVERLIQAPALPELRHVCRVGARLGLHRDRITGEPDEPEADR